MKEDFLYFLWKFQLFEHNSLETQCGLPVLIKKTGFQNNDSGPDFSNSQLSIGEVDWYGNVEMHIKSSDWFTHKHQYDAAYDTVILHVVWECNMPITDTKGRVIPTIELSKLANPKYLINYKTLNQSSVEVSCQEKINVVPTIYLNEELEQQLLHRLSRKTELWSTSRTGELKVVFFELLAQSFGFKVNSDAFLQVAQQLPLSILLKHRNNLLQVEALLFGISGMLSSSHIDDYSRSLYKEWSYLKHKYQLPEVTYIQWKFSKMRPPNFPTIKMAQLALLMMSFQDLFEAVNSNKSLCVIKEFFQDGVSAYWNSHYVFDKSSQEKNKRLGESSFYSIIINAVIPFLFLKFRKEHNQHIYDYLIDLLQAVPAEKNNKIELFTKLGVKPKSAFETQGLIELLDYKCLPKKCLSCKVGNYLVRKR